MHLCRGNFRSTHIAAGGYDPVAEVLFNGINVDGYFMEYDDERSGSFAPLRFLPKGKTVVLGLVTSKRGDAGDEGRAEAPDRGGGEVRAPRPARHRPQCGFASTEEGNLLTVEEQWAKLAAASRSRKRSGAKPDRTPDLTGVATARRSRGLIKIPLAGKLSTSARPGIAGAWCGTGEPRGARPRRPELSHDSSNGGQPPNSSISANRAQRPALDDVDYGHRHFINLVSVAFLLVLAVAMAWTVKAMDSQETLRKCFASGRKDCVQIRSAPQGHGSGGALSARAGRRAAGPRIPRHFHNRRRDPLRHARQGDARAWRPVRPPQAPGLGNMHEGDHRRRRAQRRVQRLVAQVIPRIDGGRAGRSRGRDRANATGDGRAGGERRGPVRLDEQAPRSAPGGVGVKNAQPVARPRLEAQPLAPARQSKVQHDVGLHLRDQRGRTRLGAGVDHGQLGCAQLDPKPREAASMAASDHAGDRHGRIDRRAGKGAEGGQEHADRSHGSF